MASQNINILVAVSLILSILVQSNAYVYTIPNATDPALPGVCYHTQSQLVIKPGATIKLPGNCEKIRCNEDLSIDGTGCGLVMPARSPCRNVPQDVDKPFPECCATVVC